MVRTVVFSRGKNDIRKRWEMELFGGTYEDCTPFERCKSLVNPGGVGGVGVCNGHLGVFENRKNSD
jgi:hypothetical protein